MEGWIPANVSGRTKLYKSIWGLAYGKYAESYKVSWADDLELLRKPVSFRNPLAVHQELVKLTCVLASSRMTLQKWTDHSLRHDSID